MCDNTGVNKIVIAPRSIRTLRGVRECCVPIVAYLESECVLRGLGRLEVLLTSALLSADELVLLARQDTPGQLN